MRRFRLLLGLIPLTWTLAACGGSEGPTGPTFPDVTGTYGGTWTLQLVLQSTGQSARNVCPGGITISSQSQGQITGSYIMRAEGDCDTSDSGNVSGSVRADGGVSLSLSSPGGNANEFAEITGCRVTSGDSQLSGTVSGSRLEADATFFADCPDSQGQLHGTRWTLRFSS